MILTTIAALTLAVGSLQTQAPATPSPSPQPGDSRWAPWLGCWQPTNGSAGGERVCITPSESAGVTLATLIGVQRAGEESITADGAAHAIHDTGCTGTEHAEWSHNGLRVFRNAEVTCGQDALRKVSALMFLAPAGTWIDVRLVDMAGTRSVRVRRYRRAVDQSLPNGSRMAAPSRAAVVAHEAGAASWRVEDVIEASAKVPAEAVQAALSELNAGFNLNAKGLVAMADAGVASSVIDLMVALTFPDHFIVERAGGATGVYDPYGMSGGSWGGMYDPFYSPIMYVPAYMGLYSYMDSAFWAARYGYLGYGYYNGYDPRYPGGVNGWVVVDSGTTKAAESPVEGRVVNGRGYTQIRTRAPEPVQITGDRGGGSSGTSSTGGSSSGGGASPQGYSGGSGGSDAGRTAVPRPPGR